MALLGFKSRFVPAIESGEKSQTIRGWRNEIKIGTRLDLYDRPRQKGMRLIFRAPCVGIAGFTFKHVRPAKPTTLTRGLFFPKMWVAGIELADDEVDGFARKDGFPSFAEMVGFWQDQHHKELIDFDGAIYYWQFKDRTKEKHGDNTKETKG